ncbi:MAG: excinuclease ABC subunit C [Candidatus Marinimicrobia bacterium]|jgi:excinuclease ABC subunit C|nr:excinuclease ABC subunit C [Candidatus Neomarinimicrobiota bacterium]MBT3937547.1 excinuclease ABC subunit C [Candidatus Neomarinimicrobiota bacterium]MBT3960746.1 excinuclease ABC subunit C [Candidatus Neomarinimicrobiota bacterium]MBT4382992.1 excinuclease ABC subunit C [Candidatus Neomarinimicrobiota bacterium]MBT4635136.1 excinuclease ABC subunit C [Candidatus Neomarinimicrobiota bacterium]
MKSKLKQLPTSPGVYLFRNKIMDIIYIGKAKNLRNRVRSYFRKNKHQSPKNVTMIRHIHDLEWIVVSSEVEALLTEANLIKEHEPKYNIALKDDKSFPFIRITNEQFPQIFITRTIIKDGSKYYGPFTNVNLLRVMMKALNKVFSIRTCTYRLDDKMIQEKKVDLCLDYHIRKCEGPCAGLVSEEHYREMVQRIEIFLKGKTRDTETFIKDKMLLASQEQRFEDAGVFRDQLEAIQSFKDRQRKIAANFDDRDVFALARDDQLGIVTIIRIRSGRIFSREKISLQSMDDNDEKTLQTVITRFYMNSDFIPNEICLPFHPEDESELLELLRQQRNGPIHFHYPQRGEKAKEIRITHQNAKLLLGEWIIRRKKRKELVPKTLNQLQEDLNLKSPPRRIEAFDISHLDGTNTVASMVCFIDGKPRKSEYRKFNVKTVEGIDDFASMREIVFRRYDRVKHEEKPLPDLVLIDGGKGQLSMALSALRSLGLDYLPVIGLAKRLEEVFVPGHSEAQTIHKQSPGLILLRRIRDEAHRFAITFQRQKRGKSVKSSLFDSIPGMGKKRLETLLTSFESVPILANVSPEQIQGETGIPMKICESIHKMAKEFVNTSKKE